MKRLPIALFVTTASLLLALPSCSQNHRGDSQTWRQAFPVEKASLSSLGTSRYFVLEPGYRLFFKHGDATLTVTVLKETKLVDGVQTRIIEEREEEAGALTEISRNYFAINPATGDVY